MNIKNQLPQVDFIRQFNSFEMFFEHTSCALVLLVKRFGVSVEKIGKGLRYHFFVIGYFYNEMKMIVHKTIRKDVYMVGGFKFLAQFLGF